MQSPVAQHTGLELLAEDRGRLVVVIAGLTEEAQLAGRILAHAQMRRLEVLLVGLCPSAREEQELRRRLATTAAFLKLRNVPVEIMVQARRDWLSRLKAALTHGDEIACYAESDITTSRGPLSALLSRDLGLAIIDLSGVRSTGDAPPSLLRQAGAWAVSLATIAGFVLMQARIAAVVSGPAQTVILVLLLLPEIGILLLWNAWIS
jgi:hypothetical protein